MLSPLSGSGAALSAGLVLAALTSQAEALNTHKAFNQPIGRRSHQYTRSNGAANLDAISRDRARVATKFARGATNAAANLHRRNTDPDHAKREDDVHAAARSLEKRSALAKRAANTGRVALKDYLESYIDASYSGPITVGTPAQAFTILLDSGSGDIWLPEVGSGTKHATYDASKSSTSTTSDSSWGITYESGDSLTGTLVRDSMTFGGLTVEEQIFAQANVTQSLWETLPSSGDFGFAFSRISRTGASTFFENLISEGDVANPYIGMYLTRASDTTSKSDGWIAGGSMCVGCIDSSKYSGSVSWNPVTYMGWWEVAMDGVTVNNKVISGTNINAAIDSGTSLVYLPRSQATAFYKGVGAKYVDGSYTIPCDTDDIVGLQFNGEVYNIPLSDLSLGYVSDDHTNACVLGIQSLNVYDAQGKSTALVGDLFLKAVYTVFSYSTNGAPAVGFAPSITAGVSDPSSGTSSSASAAASGSAVSSVNGTAVAASGKTSTVATKPISTSKYVPQAAPSVKSAQVESVAVYTPKSVAPAKSSSAGAASGKSTSSTRATKVQGFTVSLFNGVSSYSAKQAEASAASDASIALAASAEAEAASESSAAAASSIANANVATVTSFSTTDMPQATSAGSTDSTGSTTSAAAPRAVGLGAVIAFAVAAFAVAL